MQYSKARLAAKVGSETELGNVTRYARQLQQFARELRAASPEEWRKVVDEGLQAAHRRQDPLGLAAMVQLLVGLLDADGRFDDAITEIDGALALARNDTGAAAVLQAMRASFLAAVGSPDEARSAVSAAMAGAVRLEPGEVRSKALAMSLAARLIVLDAVSAEEVESVLAMGEPLDDSDRLFLMSVFIPYRIACGDRRAMHSWIRNLRAGAQGVAHGFRVDDALVFSQAESAFGSGHMDAGRETLSGRNALACARQASLTLRCDLLHGDGSAAQAHVTGLLDVATSAGIVWWTETNPFSAAVRAYECDLAAGAGLEPPKGAHLGTLGSILAGAEAVGMTGTPAEASSWLKFLRREVPAFVQTSVDWPASRFRVQALLAARAGDIRGARRDFEHAASWSATVGYLIEHSLSNLQLAELLRRYSAPNQERLWSRLRIDAWARLRDLGVEPTVHAYAAATGTASALSRSELLGHLTPRETAVLSLLAEGLTYKETAAELGIKWPTVQSLAHHCYEKLGVSGKARAIKAAREIGIL